MPREIELHLKSVTNLQDCYQTAKDLLTIVQNPVTSKMSTLSLAQSRSPSPQPRQRCPSPRANRSIPPDRSRPQTRDRDNNESYTQYPAQDRPQSIMKRPYTNPPPRGQGRGRSMYRSRSMGKPRWINKRCFNCNMIGHLARNCFTRTRPQSQAWSNFQEDSLQISGKIRNEGILDINNPEFDSKIRTTTIKIKIDTPHLRLQLL